MAGFLGGWLSITVGFAAPVAASAMALGKYLSHVWPGTNPTHTAVLAVVIVSAVHLLQVRVRSGFQGFFTLFKIVLIAALIASALILATPQPIQFTPRTGDFGVLISAPFAVSLVYVTYSYSGWNASVYLAGEIARPARNIPRSLILGTLLVTALYVLLNFAFLYSTPLSALEGQVEVGYIAATAFLGPAGARAMGLLISFGLVSSISSMVWAGPRVLMVVGEDVPILRALASLNRHGVPHRAVLIQMIVVIVLIATSTFESIITCLGFLLSASAMFTVLGVFVDRVRRPDALRPYKAWGYPVTPALFVVMTAAMVVYLLRFRPIESLVGLGALALGVPVYLLTARAAPSVALQRREP
jgi:APA family basic amino acid/polyamine antiporter